MRRVECRNKRPVRERQTNSHLRTMRTGRRFRGRAERKLDYDRIRSLRFVRLRATTSRRCSGDREEGSQLRRVHGRHERSQKVFKVSHYG